jgi:hypothetical protein
MGARSSRARWLLVTGLLAASGCERRASGPDEPLGSSAARWTTIAPMGTPRTLPGAIVLPSGKVLVAGGFDGLGYSVSSELFDPGTGKWTATGGLALPRHQYAVAPISVGTTQVLLAGGEWATTSNSETYDVALGTWSLTQPMLSTRIAHALVALADGRVLAIGGAVDNTSGNMADAYEIYRPSSRDFVAGPKMIQPRDSFGAARLRDGRVLSAGGQDGQHTTNYSSAELFVPGTDTAIATGALAQPRSGGMLTTIGDRAIVVGGEVSGSAVSSAEIFDPVAGTWSSTASAPTRRARGCILTLPDARVLVVGGNDGSAPSSAAEIFDPATSLWRSLPSLPRPRTEPACVVLPTGAVLVVGGYDDSGGSRVSLSTVELLSPSELGDAGAADAGDAADAPVAADPADAPVAADAADASVAADAADAPVAADAADAVASDAAIADTAEKPTLNGDAKSCKFATDCASGFCVEGVCCDAPCDAKCSSCALPWSPGKCAPQPAGYDLKHRCGAADSCASTCGAAGECVPGRPGDQCAASQCTDRSHGVGAAICAAKDAACDTGARIAFDCGAFACEPAFGACHDRCSSSDQCAGGYQCDVTIGTCLALAPSADGSGCSCNEAGAGAGGVAGLRALGALGALASVGAVVARRRRRLAR